MAIYGQMPQLGADWQQSGPLPVAGDDFRRSAAGQNREAQEPFAI
jgi:hypothetical protein